MMLNLLDDHSVYDELFLKRTVRALSGLGIRCAPLTWDRIKSWAQQFEEGPERALAWLILRSLVFRTSEQLESSFRQALKAAVQNFGENSLGSKEFSWRQILTGEIGGMTIYCGPPAVSSTIPGKSGELMARMAHQAFGMTKWYPNEVGELQENERFLLVDDATFTGVQMATFLDSAPHLTSAGGRVAIAVAIGHETAIGALSARFPQIPLFCGEYMTDVHCFERQAKYWVDKKFWPYIEISPVDVYKATCDKHGLSDNQKEYYGFGNLGVMVAYAHGIPDDSLSLLWKKSSTWEPLIERVK